MAHNVLFYQKKYGSIFQMMEKVVAKNSSRVECYLASSSPRRRELLAQIGVSFSVINPSIDESRNINESTTDFVKRMACEKAVAGWNKLLSEGGQQVLKPVIGADTCGELAGKILIKPESRADAISMLTSMSGRQHSVFSAVAICEEKKLEVMLSETRVFFRDISLGEIEKYCEMSEPMDKAGSYAIQGKGAVFVDRIEGSYSCVVGLPLCETCRLLSHFSIPWWSE